MDIASMIKVIVIKSKMSSNALTKMFKRLTEEVDNPKGTDYERLRN